MLFQDIIKTLDNFWSNQGCTLIEPLDLEVGAGTFHPETYLRSIGPESSKVAYAQACRRPTDGRYGENPNRLGRYYQYQVILKPCPDDIQQLYLESLKQLNIDSSKHDIRFVEDDWESPTLGAWGLGWEVWLNGMEITQFTYFQQMGGIKCMPIPGEITYGLERIAMYLQEKSSVLDIVWSKVDDKEIAYRDLFLQNEQEMSAYNFEFANIDHLQQNFEQHATQAAYLAEKDLAFPCYEQVIKASAVFNLLDARGAISATDRQHFILRVRKIARLAALCYLKSRQSRGFPLAEEKYKQLFLAQQKNTKKDSK